MTNYTKSTNFASKDSKETGDPLKVVKGTEIDDEFNRIQTAVNSKADIASPAFSGTPTADTPSAGDSSIRLATTAFVATSFAPIASPTLTGTPTVTGTIPETGTDTTQIATCEFVQQEIDNIPVIAYASEETAGTVRAYLDGTDLYIYTEDAPE
jgi:hypothetical protein